MFVVFLRLCSPCYVNVNDMQSHCGLKSLSSVMETMFVVFQFVWLCSPRYTHDRLIMVIVYVSLKKCDFVVAILCVVSLFWQDASIFNLQTIYWLAHCVDIIVFLALNLLHTKEHQPIVALTTTSNTHQRSLPLQELLEATESANVHFYDKNINLQFVALSIRRRRVAACVTSRRGLNAEPWNCLTKIVCAVFMYI